MHIAHPDAQTEAYEYSAAEVIEAYGYLMNNGGIFLGKAREKSREKKSAWNAPVNESAYTERDIYQYAESSDGVVQRFAAARGKYVWIPDEDLKLFLLSIFNTSKTLLSPFSDEVASKYQAELAYLLFQQYVRPADILGKYHAEDDIYRIPAMLETEGKSCRLKEGAALYPSRVSGHRLYVKSESGSEAGYISFVDDMLYYAVVPLFEQRCVQVKISITGDTYGSSNSRKVRVKCLDLWLKMIPQPLNEVTLSISSKIDKLLEACHGEDSI